MKNLLGCLINDPVKFLLGCHVALSVCTFNLSCVALLYALHLSVKPLGRSMLHKRELIKKELQILISLLLGGWSEV